MTIACGWNRLGRGALVWLLMAGVAIVNGLLRDTLVAPLIGAWALPLSGLLLSLAVLALTWLLMPFLRVDSTRTALVLGSYWVALTLVFEYLVGHYLAGRAWAEINRVFDLATGNLFLLVLLSTLVAPVLVHRLLGDSDNRPAPSQ